MAVSCALLGLADCNTYTSDLLAGAGAAAGAGGIVGGGGSGAASGSSGRAGSTGSAGTGAGPSNDAGAAGFGDSSDTGGSGGSGALGGTSGGIGAAGDTGGGAVGGGGVTGGGATGGGATGGGGVTGAGGAGSIEQIDDFENGTTTLPAVSGRNGPWYTFNDATVGGMQTTLAQLPTMLTGANARTGSSYGFHMTASGFTNYGAGLGADFVNLAAQKVAYDISGYKSIQFYAKIGASTQSVVKLLLPNVYSDSMGAKCVGTSSSTGTACNDHLFCQFSGLTTAWALYKCDFSTLQQGGFGLVQAKPYDLTKSYSMQFSFATTPAVDFWLDDMSFVLK